MIEPHLRQVIGGLLVQDRDFDLEERSEMQVVTERRPTEAEWQQLSFAWRVCKHTKSNGIIIARDLQTIGVGAGQMSRVDSVRLALAKARDGVQGGVLASDAYFPFSDGPELALEAGISAIIQPGGSVRDHETVEAVDKVGGAMVFTSRRHFLH
jgi:phosphoribosylaminoimidazolecarboxamide formyltransferase/IMP cyclohydrolase